MATKFTILDNDQCHGLFDNMAQAENGFIDYLDSKGMIGPNEDMSNCEYFYEDSARTISIVQVNL